MIFGTVGNLLLGTGDQLLGNLFSIFNIAVLTIGTLVVMYTVVVSTISTAQEGEVLGVGLAVFVHGYGIGVAVRGAQQVHTGKDIVGDVVEASLLMP